MQITPDEFWKLEEKERNRVFMEIMPWQQEEMFAWEPESESIEEHRIRVKGIYSLICNEIADLLNDCSDEKDNETLIKLWMVASDLRWSIAASDEKGMS